MKTLKQSFDQELLSPQPHHPGALLWFLPSKVVDDCFQSSSIPLLIFALHSEKSHRKNYQELKQYENVSTVELFNISTL